jgi:hypothetical protein
VPLLFVSELFADKGYRALAVSLRGHERRVIVSFDKWHHRRDDWS